MSPKCESNIRDAFREMNDIAAKGTKGNLKQ